MIGIPYGKHRGTDAATLRRIDPGYCDWLLGLVAKGDDGPMASWASDHEDELRPAPPPPASEFGLTPSQASAVEYLLSQVDAGKRIIRLQGGAGYGKSFTVAALAAELQNEHGYTPRACAVSYVATENLRKDLDRYGWTTATVARTIGLKKEIDKDTGKDQYLFDEVRTPEMLVKHLSEGNALVVDECSMINDQTAGWLFEAVQKRGGLLVLVGDERQLPPVKQETISVCCRTLDPATLTVPMRYSQDSDLYRVEQAARSGSHLGALIGHMIDRGSDEVVWTRDLAAMIARYVANYRAHPTADHRALFFRREDVVQANNRIRNELFGIDAYQIEPAEQLMILATTDTPWASEEDRKAAFARGEKLSERYYSGERFTVVSAHEDEHMGIPCWQVQFEERDEPVRVVFGLTEVRADTSKRGGSEYELAIRGAMQYAKDNPEDKDRWHRMQVLKAEFVPVAYCYATTVHRAQGQTVDFCYTVPGALAAIPGIMGRALSYVACTRARKQLIVC
jgi:exodeoxyribonuclease-5